MTQEQRLKAVWLVLFLGVCFSAAMVLTNISGKDLLPGGDPYKVQVVVPTSVALAQNSDARIAGVSIGEVSRLKTPGVAKGASIPDAQVTVVELELDEAHTPIYRDATALVRSKSIAQESFVEMTRGNPRAGAIPDGGVIPIEQVKEATQFDELTSVFTTARRRDLQRVLNGLGTGLNGRGDDLNRFIEASADITEQSAPVVDVLAEERGHVANLVDSFGRVTRALGDREEDLRVMTRGARVAAEAVASRDERLRGFVSELPPFLRQTRDTAFTLNSFSRDATPVLRDLRVASDELVPAVSELRPAARAGRRAVGELDRFARASRPALSQLEPFSRRTSSEFVPQLEGFLREYRPLAAYLSPYYREFSTFFANNSGWTSFRDQISHTLRIIVPASRSNFPGLLTAEQEKEFQRLSRRVEATSLGRNAYPNPGKAAEPNPFSGRYPRLERDPPYR